MPYFVRLSCRDCTGEDPKGCFDGGTELIDGGAENGYEPKPFPTVAEAVAAGEAETRKSIWEFAVEDETGEEVGWTA